MLRVPTLTHRLQMQSLFERNILVKVGIYGSNSKLRKYYCLLIVDRLLFRVNFIDEQLYRYLMRHWLIIHVTRTNVPFFDLSLKYIIRSKAVHLLNPAVCDINN